MKKLIVLIYIAVATLLFGYAKAENGQTGIASFTEKEKVTSGIDFPVQFENLSVKMVNNRAEISWSTLTEKNNKQFEVQRSTDGENFKTIALVFTLEDSNEIKHYTFNDDLRNVNSKKLIYRIKQVDTAEEFTFSKTVTP